MRINLMLLGAALVMVPGLALAETTVEHSDGTVHHVHHVRHHVHHRNPVHQAGHDVHMGARQMGHDIHNGAHEIHEEHEEHEAHERAEDR